ncbi:hypothetical protein J6590_103771 [Homalodisca vitripennis]|nr:hypothetical protein J6590_103771 [Homalodisca vitripennis]
MQREVGQIVLPWAILSCLRPCCERLVYDAVSDLTPGIWSHVCLKRCKESRRPRSSNDPLHRFGIRDTYK